VKLEAAAVLLDLDGVLVDSTEGVERRWRAFAVAHGLDSDEVLPVIHGRRAVDTIRALAPHLPAEELAAQLLHEETEQVDGDRPLPGAVELLAALPPERMAIVTSCDLALATARLGATGLPVPATLVTADDVAVGKPDPTGYLTGAARLGADPAACVVVEDAPAGIAAAGRAGMRCIAFATTHAPDRLTAATIRVKDATALTVTPTATGLTIETRD
jgi:sugar-phosphatase